MSSPRQTAAELNDQILDLVRKSEELIVQTGQNWDQSAAARVPNTPPEVRKLIDDAFDVAEAILKAQREFAREVLDAVVGSQEGNKRARGPSRRPTSVKKSASGVKKSPSRRPR